MKKRITREQMVTACTSLVLFCCAHAFCAFNLIYSGQGTVLDADNLRSALIVAGQPLLPLYAALRGGVASPLTIQMLCALYLSVSAVIICDALDIRSRMHRALCCGAVVLHNSVIALNASMLHVADGACLAFLLAVSGAALCLHGSLFMGLGAVLFAGAFCLFPEMIGAGLALLLLALVQRALAGARVQKLLLAAGRTLFALCTGFCAYCVFYTLLLRRYGLDPEAVLQMPAGVASGNPLVAIAQAWLYPIAALFSQATAYARLSPILAGALLAASLVALCLLLRRTGTSCGAFAMIMALLLPLAVNVPVFANEQLSQTARTLPYCFLTIGMVLLLSRALPALGSASRMAGRIFAAAFGVLFLSGIIFSNQVYLKKNLEFNTTLSTMTRVVDRAERTEGFIPGLTPVALIGTLENSAVSMAHKGFEHVATLDAASNNFTVSRESDMLWYIWQLLGYPFNLVSAFEQSLIGQYEQVQQMPAFPAAGCCQMVSDTLVIKLSN